MLSDAASDYLALYSVLLLVGDQQFGDGLAARLLAALGTATTKELIVQPYHLERMGDGMAQKLNQTGKLTVVTPAPLPCGRTPAIAPAHLDAIGQRYLPTTVQSATLASGQAVDILYQANAQASGGFVLELSNNWGVKKQPCAPMNLDPQGAVRVQVALNVDAGAAVDWATGQMVHAGPLHKGDTLTVTVAPGNTTFLEFAPAMST